MGIKGAIFDMDGTLVDSLGVWEEIWSGLGARYKGDPAFRPVESIDKACRTMTLSEDMHLIHKEFGFGKSADELLDFVMGLCVDYYKEKVELKVGVREFLEYLKASGVKTCLATASPMLFVDIALDRFDIRKCFDSILSCEEVGKNKAFPDVFLEGMRRIGCKLAETWVFEDSLTALETASSVGFKTVGIYDPNNFGTERASQISTKYLEKGASFINLIGKIE